VRDLSQLLHPAMLDDFGLVVTLEAYVQSFATRTGVRSEVVAERMDARLPSELEICIYRVVQEALTNVAKHAQATSCRVALQRLPASVLVTVEDDGRGMESMSIDGPQARAGVGLVGVRERVSRLSGTVRVETRAGNGTRLTIVLPVAAGGAGIPDARIA
jgi:signal transduction histidine kinase